MTTVTYESTPPSLDFGTLVLGNTSILTVVVRYKTVGTGQANVATETFSIDDEGAGVAGWVTLSPDGTTYGATAAYTPFNVGATQTLYVKVAPPTSGEITKRRTYTIYVVPATVGSPTPLRIAVKFRIDGGLLASVSDVRNAIKAIGNQKKAFVAFDTLFPDNTGFSNISGTWAIGTNPTKYNGTSTAGSEGITVTPFGVFTDYQVIADFIMNASQAGIVFQYTSATSFYAVMLNPVAGTVSLIQRSAGPTTTTLNSISQTLATGVTYTLRLEVFSDHVDVYLNDSFLFSYNGLSYAGYSGLRVYDSGNTDFTHYHVTEQVAVISDDDINQFIKDNQKFVEDRRQRIWGYETRTEYFNWKQQPTEDMPFIFARTFNTLPGYSSRTIAYDASIYLSNKPVFGVISVEENTTTDGSTDTWTLRSQGRDSDYVVFPELGKITFVNNYPRNGNKNIRVTYAYGEPDVPGDIRRYIVTLSAIDVLQSYGGTQNTEGIENLRKALDARLKKLEEMITPWTGAMVVEGLGRPTQSAGAKY